MNPLSGLVLRVLAVFSLSAAFVSVVVAETREIGPGDDLQQAVNNLNPDDELLLQSGTYPLQSGLRIVQKQDVVIRAKDDNQPPIIQSPFNSGYNVIEVEDSHNIVLRGLEVMGGSHGIRLMRSSSFVKIENCHIHHTGDIALSANWMTDDTDNTYQHLIFRGNHIRYTNGTGTGIALGCIEDRCRVHDSLIEGNYIHHTNGPHVTQGTGISLREGSYNNIVRDNVIHDTGTHPCILVGWTKGGEPNVLEGNFLWDCQDHGIQVTADAVIRNNIILRAAWDGIRGHLHNDKKPSNLEIIHNTILAPTNNAISIQEMEGPVVIANNALFAEVGNAIEVTGDQTQLIVMGNAGSGDTEVPNPIQVPGDPTQLTVKGNAGSDDTPEIKLGIDEFNGNASIVRDLENASYGALPQDVFPSADSHIMIGGAIPDYPVEYDFNGNPRDEQPDIGAYEWVDGGNPGWELAEFFKPITHVISDAQ